MLQQQQELCNRMDIRRVPTVPRRHTRRMIHTLPPTMEEHHPCTLQQVVAMEGHTFNSILHSTILRDCFYLANTKGNVGALFHLQLRKCLATSLFLAKMDWQSLRGLSGSSIALSLAGGINVVTHQALLMF